MWVYQEFQPATEVVLIVGVGFIYLRTFGLGIRWIIGQLDENKSVISEIVTQTTKARVEGMSNPVRKHTNTTISFLPRLT